MTRFRFHRIISELHFGRPVADAHLLSVFGNDSDVGAITAAVYDQARFKLTFPDGQVQEIALGERAACYRGGVTIPGRKHGIRHMVALSEEIRGLGSLNRTYSLSNSPEAVWSTVVHRLGIPAVPEWARRMSELFEEKENHSSRLYRLQSSGGESNRRGSAPVA